jgi:cytochrome c oxidase subunit 3
LLVWAKTSLKVWRGIPMPKVRLSVELCTIYWHFLLIVWLALFGLLFFPGGSLPVICRAFVL